MAYLFTHMEDEDDEALQVGLVNLDSWLAGENRVQVLEGYEELKLPAEAVVDLEGHDHSADNLSGVSVLTESENNAETIADALTQYSFETIIPDVAP